MEKVDKFGPLILDTRCWQWTGTCSSSGYGNFWNDGRMIGAHRFSLQVARGSLIIGRHALHRCDNRRCVNPEHIYEGTDMDNARDKFEKGRGGLRGKRWKVDAETEKLIQRRHRAGAFQKDIAKEFGLCLRTVQRCVASQASVDVPGPRLTDRS